MSWCLLLIAFFSKFGGQEYWKIVVKTSGPAEKVGQVGHLPYHSLVVHTENDVCYDFYPR